MAWLEGQLTPGESAMMSAHASECPQCSQLAQELRSALAVTLKRPLPVPDRYLAEGRAALRQALVKRSGAASLPAALMREAGLYGRLPGALWIVAGVYFTVTVVAWGLWIGSGDWGYMAFAFGPSYKIFLGFVSGAAAVLSLQASRHFEGHGGLHAAWMFIGVASLARLSGTVVEAIAGQHPDNPFAVIDSAGQFIAGPAALVCLTVGLLYAYRAYLAAGLRFELRFGDWLVVAIGVLFTARHVTEVFWNLHAGAAYSFLMVINWLSDPVLLVALIAAVVLRRGALDSGGRFPSSCWAAVEGAVLLTFVGDFLIFIENFDFLLWPYSSVMWLVWIPVYCAYALGAAYQLAAIAAPAARPSLVHETR
jgi:hypothetical protein